MSDAFAYHKHKETDLRPLCIGFAQVNGYNNTYNGTKSIPFKIKDKVLLKKCIARLGIRSAAKSETKLVQIFTVKKPRRRLSLCQFGNNSTP